MMVAPKLFTSPWTIRMPRFITDCWTQVRMEKLAISFTEAHFRVNRRQIPFSWGTLAMA